MHTILNFQGFRRKDGYIAMETPCSSGATADYWNMCNEHNCRIVVILTGDTSANVSNGLYLG